MRYQGGKSRIAQPIAKIITTVAGGGRCFVSLFCGSCAVESKVQGFTRKILNDRHQYLIALLRGVQSGYELPESITAEQYQYIREHKDEDPALAGFVGFGCSFGGKWFGGYARNATGTNYALQSKRSLLKDMATLQDASFVCNDYDVPYASVYGDIRCRFKGEECTPEDARRMLLSDRPADDYTWENNFEFYTTGVSRTGCMFCAFGAHLESCPNRFQQMQVSHPKQYDYCMRPVDQGGLGMAEVLDYIGVDH